MAEREGFEPSMEFNPHTPLAGERLQPLGHLSGITKILFNKKRYLTRILYCFSSFLQVPLRQV
jgi:hypothetical protein